MGLISPAFPAPEGLVAGHGPSRWQNLAGDGEGGRRGDRLLLCHPTPAPLPFQLPFPPSFISSLLQQLLLGLELQGKHLLRKNKTKKEIGFSLSASWALKLPDSFISGVSPPSLFPCNSARARWQQGLSPSRPSLEPVAPASFSERHLGPGRAGGTPSITITRSGSSPKAARTRACRSGPAVRSPSLSAGAGLPASGATAPRPRSAGVISALNRTVSDLLLLCNCF